MLKVLHLSAGNLYGGVETFLTSFAQFRHLAPEMEPVFALCFRGRQWDELAATGALVHDLGPVRLSRPWTVWRACRRLRRILGQARPDLTVVHSAWSHVVFAAELRRAGVPLVHFLHGEATGRGWLERWAARTPPDQVFANSRFTAGSAARLFAGTPPHVVHPPVPPPDIPERGRTRREVRAESSTSGDAVVVLIVSRIERLKGHAVLLDAMGELRKLTGWVCWVVGGAQRPEEVQLEAALKRQAEALGIADRVRFMGSRSDVPAVMSAADIYCQPNTSPEGFGLTFVEALHAGLPVITSGFGGAAEIVDGTCGVLTPPGDSAAVAAVLGELIQDPSRRLALGSAGLARASSICDPARQLGAAAALLGRTAAGGVLCAARNRGGCSPTPLDLAIALWL
jgi:glycosyltransferase involved in cell wall biosynthesis